MPAGQRIGARRATSRRRPRARPGAPRLRRPTPMAVRGRTVMGSSLGWRPGWAKEAAHPRVQIPEVRSDSPAEYGLDAARSWPTLIQHPAQRRQLDGQVVLFDREVWPDCVHDLLTRHDVAPPLDEHPRQREGAGAKRHLGPDIGSKAEQRPGAAIQQEMLKPIDGRWKCSVHCEVSRGNVRRRGGDTATGPPGQVTNSGS